MTWPTGPVETRAHEVDDDGSGTVGTIVSAADQNWVYDLLARLQTKVGPDADLASTLSHEGRIKALEALAPSENPMTTLGDTLYGDATGTPTRLGIGTAGQTLTVVDGLPAWAPTAAGLPITTPGDLVIGAAGTGTPVRLGIGTAFQLLMVQDGLPAWLTAPFIADPSGAPIGAALVKGSSGAWSYVAPTVSGYVLTSNGPSAVPSWQAVPGTAPGSGIPLPSGMRVGSLIQYGTGGTMDRLLPGAAGLVLTSHGDTNDSAAALTWAAPAVGMTNPMTTAGDLPYGGVGGAPARLAVGAAGTVLTVVAGAPAWAAPTGGAGAPDYATINWGS